MHCIRFEANTEHNFIAAVVACFTRTLICTLFLSFILCVRATVYNTSCSHSFHTIRRCRRRRRRARLFRYINSIVDSTPSRSYQPFSRGEIALRNNFFSSSYACLPCQPVFAVFLRLQRLLFSFQLLYCCCCCCVYSTFSQLLCKCHTRFSSRKSV